MINIHNAYSSFNELYERFFKGFQGELGRIIIFIKRLFGAKIYVNFGLIYQIF